MFSQPISWRSPIYGVISRLLIAATKAIYHFKGRNEATIASIQMGSTAVHLSTQLVEAKLPRQIKTQLVNLYYRSKSHGYQLI